jgi:CDP-glucose 4,6-dehydratase
LNSLLQLATSGAPHEATLLNLSIEKAERLLGWKPKWDFEETIAKTVFWYRDVHDGIVTPVEMTNSQIREYSRILSSKTP